MAYSMKYHSNNLELLTEQIVGVVNGFYVDKTKRRLHNPHNRPFATVSHVTDIF